MSENLKEFVAWLGILGIPTIFTMMSWCIKECKSFARKMDILQSAQKAQMRSQLLHQYYEYKDVVNGGGKIADCDVQEWINQYVAYHTLVGNNGVLDARKDDLLTFPTYQRN